ncbi:acyl-CoA thioester hydrolase/BAAT C-terminal domain-containing protein [uncultured Arcticibacterium sp.]|uniref:acyl-CoA thioester hydrolase/BAAT C-terminal domain-containing protein n=1 Tax=uncultured Arcticibacterium sp. TaxID=2173042 RepID=UPI0030F8E9CC
MKKYIIWVGITAFLIVGYLIIDSLLFTGIKPINVNQDGFRANYFAKENIKNRTTIVLIGGGEWGDYWAQEFAKKEMVGLSIPYTGKDGLPKLPEEIKLEYFENAIKWLKEQPEVDPSKILVMGASRNAELALILASTFTKSISGAVAYAPSAVSWSNTVLPYNSDELKASWKYKGLDIPYLPMTKIKGNKSKKIEMLDYWKAGLSKTDLVAQAGIKVENINGPILLFSGKNDNVWPSSLMADMIAQRLAANSFKHSFQNIKYDNAGHNISTNPAYNSIYRMGAIHIDGKSYEYEFGGTEEGDFQAKQDAKIKLMKFLAKI